MEPATSSSQGSDQLTRSVDSHTTSEVLPLLEASSQEVPEAMRRSVAMIQYRSPCGERISTGSRTPWVPTVERRTMLPLLRSFQCSPSSLCDR